MFSRNKADFLILGILVLPVMLADATNILDIQDRQDRRKKLAIVDTDTAVDDAMGLVMLLSNPEWKVIAVTTVAGNVDVDLATTNAMRTLNAMKRTDIPVYKGAHSAIVPLDLTDNYFGMDGLSDKGKNHPIGNIKVESESAVSALVRLVRERPGQITILALAPMTNLAMAQQLDPKFFQNVKHVHIMGGNVNGTGNLPTGYSMAAEFNFAKDSEASGSVISKFPNKPEIFTWEICQEGGVSWDVYDRMVSGSSIASRFLKDIASTIMYKERIVARAPKMSNCCCDFFTVISLVNPKSVKQVIRRFAAVELNGKLTRGMLVVDKNPHTTNIPNVDIITQVDPKEIEKSIMQMANGK